MIDAIKTVVDTIEEMTNIEAFTEDYEASRLRLQEEIKSRLKDCEEFNKCMNDIQDLSAMSREEGMFLGLYYGLKLSKLIDKL